MSESFERYAEHTYSQFEQEGSRRTRQVYDDHAKRGPRRRIWSVQIFACIPTRLRLEYVTRWKVGWSSSGPGRALTAWHLCTFAVETSSTRTRSPMPERQWPRSDLSAIGYDNLIGIVLEASNFPTPSCLVLQNFPGCLVRLLSTKTSLPLGKVRGRGDQLEGHMSYQLFNAQDSEWVVFRPGNACRVLYPRVEDSGPGGGSKSDSLELSQLAGPYYFFQKMWNGKGLFLSIKDTNRVMLELSSVYFRASGKHTMIEVVTGTLAQLVVRNPDELMLKY
ncbi:hypothetical protein EV363DRAFT_1419846 [Boletus edulis]|nr:hypothetical protein EV363DRAFT_1419846 [Boletus edulis]